MRHKLPWGHRSISIKRFLCSDRLKYGRLQQMKFDHSTANIMALYAMFEKACSYLAQTMLNNKNGYEDFTRTSVHL